MYNIVLASVLLVNYQLGVTGQFRKFFNDSVDNDNNESLDLS
jgi:hypothetical protein